MQKLNLTDSFTPSAQPYTFDLKAEDTITLHVVSFKDRLTFQNQFMLEDPLVNRQKSLRIFRCSMALTPENGAPLKSAWLCRVTKVTIDKTRRTKDGRVYIYIDVDPMEPERKVQLYTDIIRGVQKLLIKTTCGDLVETKEIPTTVKSVWYKKGDVVFRAANHFINDTMVAYSLDTTMPYSKERFIAKEIEGLEKLLSPKSIGDRFDKIPSPPEGVLEVKSYLATFFSHL